MRKPSQMTAGLSLASMTRRFHADLPESTDEVIAGQVKRAAALRAHLLGLGFYDNASLAGILQAKDVSTVRTWVARKREEGSLVTVEFAGKPVVPAVFVDEHGQLRDEIAALAKPLVDADLNGWAVWAWLCSPTGFLSGEIPSDVATRNPDRSRVAAERYAAQILGRAWP